MEEILKGQINTPNSLSAGRRYLEGKWRCIGELTLISEIKRYQKYQY